MRDKDLLMYFCLLFIRYNHYLRCTKCLLRIFTAYWCHLCPEQAFKKILMKTGDMHKIFYLSIWMTISYFHKLATFIRFKRPQLGNQNCMVWYVQDTGRLAYQRQIMASELSAYTGTTLSLYREIVHKHLQLSQNTYFTIAVLKKFQLDWNKLPIIDILFKYGQDLSTLPFW